MSHRAVGGLFPALGERPLKSNQNGGRNWNDLIGADMDVLTELYPDLLQYVDDDEDSQSIARIASGVLLDASRAGMPGCPLLCPGFYYTQDQR